MKNGESLYLPITLLRKLPLFPGAIVKDPLPIKKLQQQFGELKNDIGTAKSFTCTCIVVLYTSLIKEKIPFAIRL